MMEWSLVAALILVLGLVFMHQVRVVQRQAEFAALRAMLGTLRTALVLQHLQRQVQTQGQAATEPRNPFELLQRRPANYAGEISASQAAAVPPGNWVFEAECACVAYLPQDATEFDSPSGDAMAWYHVANTSAGGPLQITPREAYMWQGQLMN
jgi:hypothetical protein